MSKSLFNKNITIKDANELIENGIDINQVNKGGISPLMYACFYKKYKLAIFLIEKGANINYINNRKTALDIAISANSNKNFIINILRKNGAKTYDKLINALFDEDLTIEEANQLIEKGVDVKKHGGRALSDACFYKKYKIVKLLIEKGVDVKKHGGRALMYACYERNNNYKIVKLLIEKGANVNYVTYTRIMNLEASTPLKLACEYRNYSVVGLLIKNNADVNYFHNKKSILDHAIDEDDKNIIDLLRKKGAKTYAELNNKTC